MRDIRGNCMVELAAQERLACSGSLLICMYGGQVS
jgi:hypothetical protein